MSADRIAEIAARVEAATPGPWVAHSSDGCGLSHYAQDCPEGLCSLYPVARALHNDVDVDIYAPEGDYRKRDHRVSDNADFIAHAREDVPWLLAALAGATETLAQAERERQEIAAALGIAPCDDDDPPTWVSNADGEGSPVLLDLVQRVAAGYDAALRRLDALTEPEPTRYDQVPDGCWVACIAGLTGIPHDDLTALVPRLPDGSFDGSMGTEYHNAVNQTLRSRGWRLERLGPDVPKGYAIGSGTSPRGMYHAVIVRDGKLWHDPHPSREGVTALDTYEVLTPLVDSPAMHDPAQVEKWVAALRAPADTQDPPTP